MNNLINLIVKTFDVHYFGPWYHCTHQLHGLLKFFSSLAVWLYMSVAAIMLLHDWIKIIDIILKIDWLMAHTACLVCLVSTVSGRCKNALGKRSASSGHITKLEQSPFLRYLWIKCSHFVCCNHRHLRKIDWLMANTAWFVCLLVRLVAIAKMPKFPLKEEELVAGT